MEPLNDDRGRTLLDATGRVALAGLLHDLGKLAERADMRVQDREVLEINKQIYCPNPKPHPNAPGWFSHVHAAYTALALDAIESCLPPEAIRIAGGKVAGSGNAGANRDDRCREDS